MTKKRKPTDATMRNIKAINKKFATLADRVKKLEKKVKAKK